MQYTLRNVPAALDRALRRIARREGRSLNEVTLDLLARAAGTAGEPVKHRTLGDLSGAWADDPAFDDALADQDRIDAALWK